MSESGRNIPKNFNNNKNLKLFFPYRILQHNTEQIRIIALWKKLMLYDTSHWVLITQILECPFISPTSHRLFCLLRNSPIVECCVYAVYILSVITAKHLCAITSGYPNYFIVLPAYFGVDPSIARYKTWVCCISLAGIVGSNPAEGMDVCLLWVWCSSRWRSLRRTDRSSRGVLPSVFSVSGVWSEASKLRRPRPIRAVEPWQIYLHHERYPYCVSDSPLYFTVHFFLTTAVEYSGDYVSTVNIYTNIRKQFAI